MATNHPTPGPVDLRSVQGAGGVVWSISPDGFHANLVVLEAHGSIGAHRNDAVDVLVVVLEGDGTLTVDGGAVALEPGTALLVPLGAGRSTEAGSGGLRYLSVHAQRAPLTVAARRQADV